MSSKSSTASEPRRRETKDADPEGRSSRLHTTVKGPLKNVWDEIRENTPLDEPELLRQALILLANGFRENGRVVLQKLREAA